jgi:hypothetical protein
VAGSIAGSALVTSGKRLDGHRQVSVSGCVIRLRGETQRKAKEDPLRYALLIYGDIETRDRTSEEQRARMNAGVAAIVARPNVTGYLRLQEVELATTIRKEQAKSLITDGPFLDSKDFLGGFIVVEAENLDGALAVAGELQELRLGGAIEIRPVNEEPLVGA